MPAKSDDAKYDDACSLHNINIKTGQKYMALHGGGKKQSDSDL